MLISPTEPFPIKQVGQVSPIPERYGADILIVAGKVRTGVQRKKFPDDLLSSLADGRLYEQLHQMQAQDRRLLLVEGHGKWTDEGELINLRQFTKAQMFGLFFSIMFEFDMPVLQVRGINETVKVLEDLERWCSKQSHPSLRRRPGPKKDTWGRVSNEAYGAHVLQSFPGIGPELAQRIFTHFGRVPLTWGVSKEELREVPGIGKEKARKLWQALDQI